MPSQVDLIIKNALIVTVDPGFSLLENSSLAVDKGKIIAIGDVSAYKASKTIDATGKAVMPGLINSHTHAAMVLLRGYADDVSLEEWWPKYIFPAEQKICNPKTIELGVTLAALEMVLSGTTCFCDMYYYEEEAAEAVKKIGMRGVLGEALLDFPTPDKKNNYKESLEYITHLAAKYKNDPLIFPAVSPHAPYTCSPEVLLAAREFADKQDLPLQIHLAETRIEVEQVKGKYGKTPTQHLDSIGFFSERVACAHCVWMTDQDLEILHSKKVSVCHSPESNMKLASGIAPVEKMLRKGINVGLATDSAASNNNLDLFTEMDSTAKLHKVDGMNPTFLPAEQIIRMATINGAKALRLDSFLGSIEEGKAADLILIDLNKPHLTPCYNIISNLIYASNGADVDTVIVNGKIIMENRKILNIDEKEVLAKAREVGNKIYKECRGAKK